MISISKKALLIVALLATSSCTSLFFYPERELLLTPETVGLAYQDLSFKMSDGETIHGWFLPAKGEAKKTIFFLHGNAENISTHLAAVYWLPSRGYNVALIDYRGYGHSSGEADLERIHSDVVEVWKQLAQRPDIDPSKIVLFGQSLGGAIALNVAANPEISSQIVGLIVESPFIGYRRIAREKLLSFWVTAPFFWLPYLVINDNFSPSRAIEQIPTELPILVISCKDDLVIPVKHSEDLLKILSGRKVAGWFQESCVHGGFLQGEENRQRLVSWLGDL